MARACAHRLSDLVFADRPSAPRIDPDVDHAVVLAPEVMDVSAQEPTAIIVESMFHIPLGSVVTSPFVREMRERDATATDVDADRVVPDGTETRLEIEGIPLFRIPARPAPAAVVVTGDEVEFAVELPDESQRLGDFTHCDISEHPHVVARCDAFIPTVDEVSMHRVQVTVTARAVGKDVLVSEMPVRGEPLRHAAHGA